jgi:imidazolonepropionase-like amidohydrolase
MRQDVDGMVEDLEDQVGQIAPGMQADLLLLDANPLEDIRHTRKINRVMLGGEWVR